MPRIDTFSYYNSNDPDNDDQHYFEMVEAKRGRTGFHMDLAKFGELFSLELNNFAAHPTFRGVGNGYEAERLDIMQKGGYRVVLSGLGGDEFHGGSPDPLPQLADLVVQLKLMKLGRELFAWSLVKRRPWIQLLLQTFGVLLPQVVGTRLLDQGKVESWIDGRFANRHKLSRRQLEPLGRYGFWLPSRQRYAQVLEALARQITHSLPPSGVEEKRHPFLDRNLVEFIVSIPAAQLLRPGERRFLMKRAFQGLVPREVLERRTKASAGRSYMIAIENQWDDLANILNSPYTSRLGYIDGRQFREALRAMKNGRVFSQPVRLLRALSLELWMRNLAERSLI